MRLRTFLRKGSETSKNFYEKGAGFRLCDLGDTICLYRLYSTLYREEYRLSETMILLW